MQWLLATSAELEATVATPTMTPMEVRWLVSADRQHLPKCPADRLSHLSPKNVATKPLMATAVCPEQQTAANGGVGPLIWNDGDQLLPMR